ncbi:MAG TPA: acylphosphatase [Candidatus Limnocylindrales bacterium]|nr:acylphosphatase [Candidatus Limnocylindrales bacterium]
MADRPGATRAALMAAKQRMTAHVIGYVQGVGFRWWIRTRAAQLGLTGWVMNENDERGVAVVAEGAPAQLDQLERLLWRGPGAARVDRVDAARAPASGEFERFEISRS